jgi:multiple sugar transport system ATP-binding protein
MALDLEVAEGEFVTLLGPSGCGKTTTLASSPVFPPTAGGPSQGRRAVGLPSFRRDIGVVFEACTVPPGAPFRRVRRRQGRHRPTS